MPLPIAVDLSETPRPNVFGTERIVIALFEKTVGSNQSLSSSASLLLHHRKRVTLPSLHNNTNQPLSPSVSIILRALRASASTSQPASLTLCVPKHQSGPSLRSNESPSLSSPPLHLPPRHSFVCAPAAPSPSPARDPTHSRYRQPASRAHLRPQELNDQGYENAVSDSLPLASPDPPLPRS